MKVLLNLLIIFLLAPVVAQSAPRFTDEGLELDAGSLGKFTLEYPQLLGADQQTAHKLHEKRASGATAVLQYEGGSQLDLALGENGRLVVKLTQVSADVKSVSCEMHIPIAFNQGGQWGIGDKKGNFPKEKPSTPHLFQDHAPAMKITNYEGRSLEIVVPEFTFQQLTDNREWNWSIFNWRAHTPLTPDGKELAFTIKLSAPAEGPKALVDQFGQAMREEWPGQVKTLDELKADVASESAWYASLTPPELDRFGGLPGSREKLGLQATGFFHVEKKGDRWLLVNPAGNAFFHLGLCSSNPNEDFTLVKGRESAYEWLPPRDGEFASAWKPDSGGTVVSFHLANLIRKYGQPYSADSYASRMVARMRKWGFNSIGAFSAGGETAWEAAQFPRVASLPLNDWHGVARLPGIGETFDPFDEKTRAQVEANLAKELPARANDPLLIGYFIVNEPIYENIPHLLPTLKSNHACKRRFVAWLTEKYKTVAAFNIAWALHAVSFDALGDMALPVESPAAKADVQEFTGVFLEEYFRLITDTYRKHDKNHLLLGCRLQSGTINNAQLCRIAGKYVDVMSFNYYTNGVDKSLLRRIYDWTGGKPMMLSEFYWGAAKESGLAGGREVATQQERGLAYRNYVEQSAALGFVVGIEWFTLIDQAVTGRWFQGFDGERANTGVLSVADRPWKPMLEEAMKTNYDIYRVWLGERPPFAWEDARFKNAP
jgi:hypothetical protein